MAPSHQLACLAEIQQIWRTTAEAMRPCSVWIAEHAPMPHDAQDPSTPVVRAWYMDAGVPHPRGALDFVRFITVHAGGAWAQGANKPPALAVFNNRPGRIHTIGLASFAPIQESALVYLDFVWGGTFGRGSRYAYNAESRTVECVENLWIS